MKQDSTTITRLLAIIQHGGGTKEASSDRSMSLKVGRACGVVVKCSVYFSARQR
jgi:hypothetical protein